MLSDMQRKAWSYNDLYTKVGTRNAMYVWTQKTWSFDKLHKVGVSLTPVPFHLRVVNDRVR